MNKKNDIFSPLPGIRLYEIAYKKGKWKVLVYNNQPGEFLIYNTDVISQNKKDFGVRKLTFFIIFSTANGFSYYLINNDENMFYNVDLVSFITKEFGREPVEILYMGPNQNDNDTLDLLSLNNGRTKIIDRLRSVGEIDLDVHDNLGRELLYTFSTKGLWECVQFVADRISQ